MIISGVVIDVDPASGAEAADQLRSRPGIIRIEGPVTPGRLVAVIEAENEASMDGLVGQIMTVPGIVNVSPAYIHFDA